MPYILGSPALDIWRRELLVGVGGQHHERPGTWRSDALYLAACYEAHAVELERQGVNADDRRARAVEILAEAAGGGHAA